MMKEWMIWWNSPLELENQGVRLYENFASFVLCENETMWIMWLCLIVLVLYATCFGYIFLFVLIYGWLVYLFVCPTCFGYTFCVHSWMIYLFVKHILSIFFVCIHGFFFWWIYLFVCEISGMWQFMVGWGWVCTSPFSVLFFCFFLSLFLCVSTIYQNYTRSTAVHFWFFIYWTTCNAYSNKYTQKKIWSLEFEFEISHKILPQGPQLNH
jgi:hypothetical protein